jgi:metallo-beta-lactamase class B
MIFRGDEVEVSDGRLRRIGRWTLPLFVVLVLFSCVAPTIVPTRAEDSPEIKQQIEAARKLAGTDWASVLDFQLKSGPEIVSLNILPKPASPAIEPRKVFDNLYVIGQKAVSNFVITTPDGLILIDTGYDGNAEKIILPQMKQLGLNPEDIRYILLTHGHADHFGGAKYFQDHYKNIRVGLSAADWDFIPSQGKGAKPTKDLVLEEGKPITLGGESITPVSQPGHTPGAMAFIFPVKDFGKPHMVLILGAVQLNPEGVPLATLRQVDESLNYVAGVAERMHVDTELAVHPIWDSSEQKMEKIATRKPGEPNPFVVGEESNQRLMKLLDDCMKIQIARLSQTGS